MTRIHTRREKLRMIVVTQAQLTWATGFLILAETMTLWGGMLTCVETTYSKLRSDRPKCRFVEDNDENEELIMEEYFDIFCSRCLWCVKRGRMRSHENTSGAQPRDAFRVGGAACKVAGWEEPRGHAGQRVARQPKPTDRPTCLASVIPKE